MYRLVVGRTFDTGFRGTNQPYWRIDVQMWTPFLHNAVYGSWNAWADGLPSHSTDGVVIGNFGSALVEDGKFPWRVAGLPVLPPGGVLALAVPDITVRGNLAHNDVPAVHKRYPDPYRLHLDMGSRFPLSRISTWDSYWKDAILKEVLRRFGEVDPKPDQDQMWVWRLVYAPSHNRFVIQSQMPPSTGAGRWTSVDGADNEPTNGLGPASTHFGFAYTDFFEADRLYECPTVLGMHFGSASGYSLARYDYGDLGHDRLTGSVDFETRGCGCGSTPKPKREFVSDPALCGPIAYTDPEPPGMPVPVSDIGLGYTVDPTTGMSLAGWEAANVGNHFLTNFYLCGIREALRAINANLVEGVKALDDARQVLDLRLGEIASALRALQGLGVDTSRLERKIQDFIDKMDDLLTVQF